MPSKSKNIIPADGEDGPHMRRCSRCGKCFPSRRGANDHIRTTHAKKGALRVSARYEDRHPDVEPSLGTQVVEAQIARVCHDPVDPVIADMFDV